MRRIVMLLWLMLIVVCNASAQPRFNAEGKFKIVQFTDAHVRIDREDQMAKTVKRLRWIIQEERPDLVVFTGDVVTGSPALYAWRAILAPVAASNTPFVVVLGNHDLEEDLTAEQLADIICAYPNSLNTKESGRLDDLALEVGSEDGERVEAIIYCLDSQDYSTDPNIEGYGWILEEQIEWYKERSRTYTELNNGIPIPAYALFHIPLPEYRTAVETQPKRVIGIHQEDICAPNYNSGMFEAMVECGDVNGIFVGHDHNNNFIVPYRGIALCYGHFSGDQTVYNKLYSGVRIIELDRNGNFETWVRDYRRRHRTKLRDHVLFDNQTSELLAK